jgi:hypothetical protein
MASGACSDGLESGCPPKKFRWTQDLNRDLYLCYLRAENEKFGYMRRLRDLWIGLHPELNSFTAQNLRDRVSYLKRSNKVPQMLLSSTLTRQDSREDPREDSCVCNDVTADVSMTVSDLFQPDDLPRLLMQSSRKTEWM